MKKWLYLVIAAVCVLSLAVIGCAKKPAAPTPGEVITLVHEDVYPSHHRCAEQDRWWQEEGVKACVWRIKFEYHQGSPFFGL